MSPSENLSDDSLVDQLLAWDEALQTGSPPPEGVDLPPDQRARLEGDLRCLRLLREALSQDNTPKEKPFLPDLGSDRFVIECELGRGAHGIVYLAFDTRLSRSVALKVERPEVLATPELRERFLREARAAAALNHPNLIPLYEVGSSGLVCYLASAYCPGPTLAAWLRDRTAPVAERLAARLAATLAGALEHAHSRGVLHRDVKPGNVLLEPLAAGTQAGDGLRFVPRLGDFGLARILAEDEASQTRSGTVVGTPSYMAPEQARGHNRAVGPRADVYALGAVLYECLTGRPPFQAESVLELLEQVRDQEPPLPRWLRPGLSRDLETICVKCLQKEPNRRYATAQELADDLGRFLDGKPVRARPIGPLLRLGRWCRRNRAAAVAATLILLAVLAVVGLSLSFGVERTHTARRLKGEQERTAAALHDSRLLAARLAQEQGLSLCSRGESGQGLLYLAYALSITPPEEESFQHTLRIDLDAWRRQVHPLRAVLPAGDTVMALAFSADGRSLLAAGNDLPLQVWDAHTGQRLPDLFASPPRASVLTLAARGKLLLTVERGQARVWDLGAGKPAGPAQSSAEIAPLAALSPDGRILLTSSRDRALRRWDVASGHEIGRAIPSTGYVLAAAFAPDGRTFLTGEQDGTVRLRDTKTGESLGAPWRHGGMAWSVAFSPDGRTALVGCSDHTARLWEAATGRPLGPPLEHRGLVHAVAFSPDGRLAITGSEDRTARLWDLATGQPFGAPLPHGDSVYAVAFRPDGKQVATAGRDGTIRLWDVAGLAPLRAASVPPVLAQAFSSDGRTAVLAGTNRVVHLWDLVRGRCIGSPLEQADPVGLVAFSPDGRTAAVRGPDTVVRLWDTATARLRCPPLHHGGIVWCMAFSPDSRVLATGTDETDGRDNEVRLWAVASGHPLGQPRTRRASFHLLAFSSSGDTLLAAGPETALLHPVREGLETGRPLARCGTLRAAAFSRNGRFLVAGGKSGVAGVWDVSTGALLRELPGSDSWVSSVAISPNDRIAAAGTVSGRIRRWDIATGALLGPPLRHAGDVTVLAFSPDRRFLASASEDGTARLWETSTGRQVGPPVVHPQRVSFLSFDDSILRTGSIDGTAQVREVPSPVLGHPEDLLLWAEVLTGLTLDNTQAPEVLDAQTWEARRHGLKERKLPAQPGEMSRAGWSIGARGTARAGIVNGGSRTTHGE